jgi:hypothetical protein
MSEPGYYKVNYRALRLRELRGAFRWYLSVPLWLAFRLMRMSRGGTWMPLLWDNGECKPEDLSDDFWQATKSHRAEFEELGFTQCRLIKPPKSLEPIVRDHAAIYYLDSTRSYFGSLTYIRVYEAVRRKELNRIRLSFTAASENDTLTCVNRSATFDARDSGRVVSVNSSDVRKIYQRFREELQQCPEAPRSFPDLESLREWFDSRAIKSLDDCVRRRLFIRLTEPEVAAARANLERNAPGLLLPRLIWSMTWLAIFLAVLVLILEAAVMVHQHWNPQIPESVGEDTVPMTTVDYQGQKFKLSHPYTDWDVYKNDPNNLDSNELPRIVRTMEAVEIPATFNDYKEFIYVTANLEFPGYGESAGMGQADDGSKLLFDSFEIPQAGKERVVVARGGSGGSWTLVDDFIYAGSDTNDIRSVRLDHGQLEYFDRKGRLLRKKAI